MQRTANCATAAEQQPFEADHARKAPGKDQQHLEPDDPSIKRQEADAGEDEVRVEQDGAEPQAQSAPR